MDVPMEDKCMRMCTRAGITCISVAHRPTLLQYHDDLLKLDGSGGLTFGPVGEQAEWLRQLTAKADALIRAEPGAKEAVEGGSGGGAGAGATVTRGTVRSAEFPSVAPSAEEGLRRRAHSMAMLAGTGSDAPLDVNTIALNVRALSVGARRNVSSSFGVQPPKGMAREVVGGFGLPDADGKPESMTFNRAFFRRFWVMLKLGWPEFFCKPTGVLIVTVLVNIVTAFIQVSLARLAGPIYEVPLPLLLRAWGGTRGRRHTAEFVC